MFQCNGFQENAFQNDCTAEALSGGWRPSHGPRHWPREESDDAREARIRAERVRMGILPPDPAPPALPAPPSGPGETLEASERPYSLPSRLLVEGYQAIEALAARAATRALDDVIDARVAALSLDEAGARWRRLRHEEEWILLFE